MCLDEEKTGDRDISKTLFDEVEKDNNNKN